MRMSLGYKQFAPAALKPQDVFAATLWTANNTNGRLITTGLDLPTFGGLAWLKTRNQTENHALFDTLRTSQQALYSNSTSAQTNLSYAFGGLTGTGFTVEGGGHFNSGTSGTAVAWSFRRAAKFFDVVTWTGNGTAGRQIAHSLGVAPGMMIIKNYTNAGAPWGVYHRSVGATATLLLNDTTAAITTSDYWNNTAPSPTSFTVGTAGAINQSGDTYVAYLFAHDPDPSGIVQCGSFASGATVNLGWRPQFLLFKNASTGGGWNMLDTARGFTGSAGVNDAYLQANSSAAEASFDFAYTTSTGFQPAFSTADTQVYLAIREPI